MASRVLRKAATGFLYPFVTQINLECFNRLLDGRLYIL